MSTLPRLPIGEVQTFVEEFLKPERPVVLTGAPPLKGSASDFVRRARADPDYDRRRLWINVGPAFLETLLDVPELVAALMEPKRAFSRRAHLRAWVTSADQLTPLHYDASSLEVFNLHLSGRKRWRLLGPDARASCVPFSEVGLPSATGGLEVLIEAGSLLYLPRYWLHEVRSLDPVNLAVNWVCTPRRGASESARGRREAELLWWKWRLQPLLSPLVRAQVQGYGGVGEEAVALYSQGIGAGRLAGRLLKELARVPSLLAQLPTLRQTQRRVAQQQQEQEALMERLLRDEVQSTKGPG